MVILMKLPNYFLNLHQTAPILFGDLFGIRRGCKPRLLYSGTRLLYWGTRLLYSGIYLGYGAVRNRAYFIRERAYFIPILIDDFS